MAPPNIQDYLFTLYTSADSYDFGEGQALEVIADLNQDGLDDKITYHYESSGFRFDVQFGTTVGCGAPGFYATQTFFAGYESDRFIYNALLKNTATFRPVANDFRSQSGSEIQVDWNKVLDRYPMLEKFIGAYTDTGSWKFAKVFALLFRSPQFCKMFDAAMRTNMKIVPQPNPGQGSFFIQSENTICLDLSDPMLAITSLLHEIAHYDDDDKVNVSKFANRKDLLNFIVNNEVASDQFATSVMQEIGLTPLPEMEFQINFNLLKDKKTAEAFEVKKYQLSSLGCTYLEQAYLLSIATSPSAEAKFAEINNDYVALKNIYFGLQELFHIAGKNGKTVKDIFDTNRFQAMNQKFPEIGKFFTKYQQQFSEINLIQLSQDNPAAELAFNRLMLSIKTECIKYLVTAHAQKFGFTDLLQQ